METHPDGQYVIGPYGNRLTVADLPPARTKRWTSRRKAEVVAAVRGGLISLDEACTQYALTKAEFVNWQKSFEQHGLEGLKTKRHTAQSSLRALGGLTQPPIALRWR